MEQSSTVRAAHEDAAVITIVRDPKHALGKRFALLEDGTISKESRVVVAFGIAEQRHVPDAQAMAALLREVANDPHAAVINAYFPDIPISGPFAILSEQEMERRLGLKTRDARLGVHSIEHQGRKLKAVGRLKENVRASAWQLLDRDIDHQTPAKYGAAMGFDAWVRAMGDLLPGISSAPLVRTGSSSARVLKAGEPVGAGNGHVWVQLADARDAERLRVALQIRAAELGMAWRKLNKHGTGGTLTTIIDTSVFIPGRLVFCGKPTVAGRLDVVEPTIEVLGGSRRLDTAGVQLPPADRVRALTRDAGVEMTVRKGEGNSLAVDAYDLTYDTEIEVEGGEVCSVRDALGQLGGPEDKLRCQTPFRESESWAGVLRVGKDGRPCLFDVGTGTTHWLNDPEHTASDFEDQDEQDDKVLADIEARIDGMELAGEEPEQMLLAVQSVVGSIGDAQRVKEQVDGLIKRLTEAGCDEEAAARALQPKADGHEYTLDLSRLKPVEFAVDGFLSTGLTVIAGAPGVGKTSMLVPLAAAVAGLFASGIEVVLRRKVVYVSEAPEQVERILYGLVRHAPGARPAREFAEWVRVIPSRRLPSERLASLIRALVKKYSVTFNDYPVAPLIILDTSNATLDLENENDNAEVGRAISAIKENLASGACWLVAHTPKALQRADAEDLTARGAGAFAGDANATAIIFLEPDIPEKRFMAIRKHRFEATFTELEFSTETHQERVATPWGTEQTITYRIGLPEPSHQGSRLAAKERAKAERDEQHLTRRSKEIKTLIVGYLQVNPGGKSKNAIEKAVRRNAQDVRTCIAHMVEDSELVVVASGPGGGVLYDLPPEPALVDPDAGDDK